MKGNFHRLSLVAAGDTLCPFSRKMLETADLKSCGYHVGHHWGFLEIVRVGLMYGGQPEPKPPGGYEKMAKGGLIFRGLGGV